MIGKILSHPVVHFMVMAMIVLGVLVCIFPHYIPSLSWGVNYAVHLMLFFLVAGVVMLFARQPRLTFAFFAGCAFLCVFLKYSVKSNGLPHFQRTSQIVLPTSPDEVEVGTLYKVAHFNLTNSDSISQIIRAVIESEADLVTVHEVTPNWSGVLKDSLSTKFPFHHTMVDIGIFGMAIYSQYDFESLDTFYYQEIPNLKGCINGNGESLCFMSVQTEPALNDFSLRRLKEHLDVVVNQVQMSDYPAVVLGDFNAVSWSGEIQSFLEDAGLMESRTGFMPYPLVSTTSMFKVPLDHIFYSDQLQCVSFENIVTSSSRHLGIIGTYGQKNMTYHAKKTAQ